MTGTTGPRTGRARVFIADDDPAPDEVLSVAVEHRLGGLGAGADDSVHVLGDLVTTEDTREVRRAGVSGRLTAEAYDPLARPRQILSKARGRVIPAVRGLGYAIRAAEDGR
jgi:hypothetical protein